MRDLACPDDGELRGYLLGQLAEVAEQQILEHLAHCPTCEASAARLDELTDPLIDVLRELTSIDPCKADSTTSTGSGARVSSSHCASRLAALLSLPGYEMLEQLGQGGTSVVYKARQLSPRRFVALKMILSHPQANPERQARFLGEADATAKLQHPHIVQIYAAGFHDGLPFLALEYMAGGSLAQRLAGVPQPPREAAALVETLARAAHHAHRHGIIHRDLKPANILFTPDGLPKIADFGLAKHERPDLTATGTVLGTPSYMAPEQAVGDKQAVGPAADVYALGAILYELLTGRPPFCGATVLDTLDQVRTQEPVPPLQLQPKTPRDLNIICLKCLHKESRKRYGSAEELADDLRRFQAGEAIRGRATGRLEKTWRWSRRNPGWATAAVLLVMIAAGSAFAAFWLAWALSESETAHNQTRNAQREAVRQLVRSRIDEARALRLSHRVGQRHAALDLLLKARDEARTFDPSLIDANELRIEAIACLALPDLELQREWSGAPEGTTYLDFDGTFTHYARSDAQGAVSVRRIADDWEVFGLPPSGSTAVPFYNPDGHYLGILNGRGLHVYRTSDYQMVWEAADAQRPSFSLDKRRLAVLHKDNSINIWDLVAQKELDSFKPDVPVTSLALHPARAELAVCTTTMVRLYDLHTKKALAELQLPAAGECLDWNPAGDTLAISCDDQNIWLWNVGPSPWGAPLRTTRPFSVSSPEASWRLRCLSGHKDLGIEFQFNSDGRLLASTDWSGVLRVWDMREGRQIVMPLSARGRFRFGQDPDLLGGFFHEGKLRLYRVTAGQLFRQLLHHSSPGQSGLRQRLLFHPRGRWLVGGANDGLAVWDARSGAELVQPTQQGWHLPVAFDASGALLALNPNGLNSCPVEANEESGRCRIGASQLLVKGWTNDRPGCSRDGRVLAIPRYNNGAELVHRDQPEKRRFLQVDGQRDVRFCAVSPDGSWVATGNFLPDDKNVVIWDARDGKLVHTLPVRSGACVHFSPDGRWLTTDGRDTCRLWSVAAWQEHLTINGHLPAFTPDGKILAVGTGEGVVGLFDPDSGREYARLTAPGETFSWPVCFSPDSSQLVVAGQESRSAHIWDLRNLREELRRMDLDWDLPPYPPGKAIAGPERLEQIGVP